MVRLPELDKTVKLCPSEQSDEYCHANMESGGVTPISFAGTVSQQTPKHTASTSARIVHYRTRSPTFPLTDVCRCGIFQTEQNSVALSPGAKYTD
jgi:hypothetical protein